MAEKVINRETCKSCKDIKDVSMLTMSECVGCHEDVCLDCACSQSEAELFMTTTGKGKVIRDDPDPEMNGPCGWVCPSCFRNQFGKEPKRLGWTENSPSSGDIVKSGQKKSETKSPD